MGCRAQRADPSLSEISDDLLLILISDKSRRGALSKLKCGECVETNQLRSLNLHNSDQQQTEVISFLLVKYFRDKIEGKFEGVWIFSDLRSLYQRCCCLSNANQVQGWCSGICLLSAPPWLNSLCCWLLWAIAETEKGRRQFHTASQQESCTKNLVAILSFSITVILQKK